MKKITQRLAVSILLTLVVLLSGCASETAAYEEKSYTASVAEVDTLTVDVTDRKIEILPSKDEKIHLSYYESKKEAYALAVSNKKELSMVLVKHKSWKDYIGGKAAQEKRTIQVWLSDAAIENLNVKTSNETIALAPLSCSGTVKLTTNNGNIQLNKLDVGTAVTLEAKNGDINGSIAGSYDDFAIFSQAKKGESSLPGEKKTGEKKVNAKTNNGDINLEIAE